MLILSYVVTYDQVLSGAIKLAFASFIILLINHAGTYYARGWFIVERFATAYLYYPYRYVSFI